MAEAWYLRDCFKVGSALLLLGHGNQGSVCNTHNNPRCSVTSAFI